MEEAKMLLTSILIPPPHSIPRNFLKKKITVFLEKGLKCSRPIYDALNTATYVFSNNTITGRWLSYKLFGSYSLHSADLLLIM